MKYFCFVLFLVCWGGCEKEPLYNEPVVGNTYYVEDDMGQGLYNWTFHEDGTLREVSQKGFSSLGEYRFEWEGGIKNLVVSTLSENSRFACDYSDAPNTVFLTNLNTFQVLILVKI